MRLRELWREWGWDTWSLRLAGTWVDDVKVPGVWPIVGSALVLLAAAVIASVLPAARAARVDVMQALRSD